MFKMFTRNCLLFSNFTLFSWTCIIPLLSDKNHSLYLKKFYGHSQDLSVTMYYHYMDVTETLTVTRNEHIEIVGKGDLDVGGGGVFFSLLLD